MAESFNKYFLEVGFKLTKELPPPVGPSLVDDMEYKVESTSTFKPVTESQVDKCMEEVRGGSAPGYDNIIPSTLKIILNICDCPWHT